MKNNFFLVLFFLITSFIQLKAEELLKLNLRTAIELALDRNPLLKASQKAVEAAQAEVTKSYLLLLPSLSLTGMYSRISPQDETNIFIPPSTIINLFSSIEDNWLFRLDFSQKLFTGFRIKSAIEIAQSQFNYLQAKKELKTQEIILAVIKAYLNFAQAKKAYLVAGQSVKVSTTRLQEIKNLFQQGLATQNEVLKAELYLSQIKVKLIESENFLALAKAQLNLAIGIELESQIEIEETLNDLPKLDNKLEEFYKKALGSRAEVFELEAELQACKAALQQAQASFYPQLILKGSFTYANPNPSSFPRKAEWKDSYDFGVAVQLELGDYPQAIFAVTKAQQQQIQTQEKLQALRNQIQFEVYQSYLEIKKTLERLEVAKKMQNQAQENLRVIGEKQKQGFATNTDVLDAQLSWFEAELFLNEAKLSYQFAYYQFLAAQGILWIEIKNLNL